MPANDTAVPECTAAELEHRLRLPGLAILDVRSPEAFARGAIRGAANLPAATFHAAPGAAAAALPPAAQIVVVCNRGNSSQSVTRELLDRGRNALSLRGGMRAWNELLVPRIAARLGAAAIVQFDRVGKGCLSYLLATPAGGWAIDPARFLEPYLATAAEFAAPLCRVLDTHAHADHVSGGRDLAQLAGAAYALHPYDALSPFDLVPARFDFEPLWDGQRERLGTLDIRILHTPGHTLGEVSLLIDETYLLAGDTVFLRSLGRPDLGGQAEAWSRVLHATLRKLAALSDDVIVLPGHYAEVGEARADGVFSAPLGELRGANDALAPREEAEFLAYIESGRREIPPPYRALKRLNLGLEQADAARREELETGQNLCALAHA